MRQLAVVSLVACFASVASAGTPDFWAHWGDGKAEVNGYRLVQPRYGAPREGTAILVFVTEEFSDHLRVKADPGKHPATDVYPVMKLNAIRRFATGIYTYNTMTSTFLRVAPRWPLAKVSFSSQEWCGQVWHQLLPRGGRLAGLFHSYFDGEADGSEDLEAKAEGVLEDALPVLVRSWMGEYVPPGQSRTVPFLPSLLRARLEHRPLAWSTARIRRASSRRSATVAAGSFRADVWTVEIEGRRTLEFDVESAPPFRLLRVRGSDGEEMTLRGSARLAYWKLNQPGGEAHLGEVGLSPR